MLMTHFKLKLDVFASNVYSVITFLISNMRIEPRHEKPSVCICESAFGFAKCIVLCPYFLHSKLKASSYLLGLTSPVCVALVGNPDDRFFVMLLNWVLVLNIKNLCVSRVRQAPKRSILYVCF